MSSKALGTLPDGDLVGESFRSILWSGSPTSCSRAGDPETAPVPLEASVIASSCEFWCFASRLSNGSNEALRCSLFEMASVRRCCPGDVPPVPVTSALGIIVGGMCCTPFLCFCPLSLVLLLLPEDSAPTPDEMTLESMSGRLSFSAERPFN